MTRLETVEAFFKAYNQHDVPGMLACFSQEASFEYVPYGDQGKGKVQEYAPAMWNGFIEAFPDFKIEVKSISETTRQQVIAETINGGTQAKEIYGIPNQGLSQYTPHVFFFDFDENHKISYIKAYWDNNTIYAQLKYTEAH